MRSFTDYLASLTRQAKDDAINSGGKIQSITLTKAQASLLWYEMRRELVADNKPPDYDEGSKGMMIFGIPVLIIDDDVKIETLS